MKKLVRSKWFQELLFQIVVCFILFLFFSYNQDNSLELTESKIAFFLNYLTTAMFINYVLTPYLYSSGKIGLFFISVSASIIWVILIDEYVLEQIYYPDTRGTYFPGILFTLLETLPLITAFVGLKFAWDYHRKQREIDSLKSLVQESELQFLKSQINPHFLFNNLNNLYVHAIDNSVQTPRIIIELSSVLRYMLYDCKEKYTPLTKEIGHLKNYTALNELQIGDRGSITFNSPEHENNFIIAPLILIVFIENAFKHSTASQSEDIYIDIDINIDDSGLLTFSCKNSFLPVQNTYNLDKGIGLINVKKRLELLYAHNHELHIEIVDGIYQVILTIELNKDRQ